MLGWFFFRPGQIICQDMHEPSALSVPIHHKHTHTHACAHAVARAAGRNCSTKKAAGWTLHSGPITPQGKHIRWVMAAVGRHKAVPIKLINDDWQHDPDLHRYQMDSKDFGSGVSKAFGGVQHWNEFLHGSWEKGISSRAIGISQLGVQGHLQTLTWGHDSAFAHLHCQDRSAPQLNHAKSCPKLAFSYLSTFTLLFLHTTGRWGNCKVLLFNHLAEFTKAENKAVSTY